ncbi:aspartate/glutamate racemase family protein [Mucilaginibacter agri]|uniref:Amino acid racemase n=1 Tax=Mucilaginibacter agri TaxID=2695265 RepID=A0A965ZEV9_9SPHI|nr:amino acid racemase [Mucilaginibacter agri]NCD69615.1 amino acid racemase [Mucilaginibacter agri]
MHKKIGIIGGLSPESTVSYYLYITRKYVELFGDYSYPEILVYSVNLEDYHTWRDENRWDKIEDDMVRIADLLKNSGADLGLIATNTMHKVFNGVQSRTNLALIHIMQPTIEEIKKSGIKTIGLLGTRFTMAESFYKNELLANGLNPLVPDESQQAIVHQIIVDELVRGVCKEESKKQYLQIIDELVARGAEGVILGCTEIPLLIGQKDCSVPVFDTAILHAEAALQQAVSEA